jgi:DedD protein
MRSILETEKDESTDTEITLGMKSLLGVFFGLVLICGVFFGFGYSLGHSNTNPGSASANALSKAGSASKLSAEQEPPGSSTKPDSTETSREPQPPSAAEETASAATPTTADNGQLPRKPAAGVVKPSAQEVLTTAPPVAPRPTTAAESATSQVPAQTSPKMTPVSTSAANAGSSAQTMVQIAAVSHQEDANVLVAALKKRGYTVVIRNDPKDSLLHVQIGPFASRDEAKAMRSKLLADGYNAILK